MTKLLAIISFILSLIFYAWSISHGIWTWQFFMILGLALDCLSDHPKVP